MRAEQERDNWKHTAEQHCRNEQFYRGIIDEIGALFGDAAKTSDDGTIQDHVLALRVPELVRAAVMDRDSARPACDAAERINTKAGQE